MASIFDTRIEYLKGMGTARAELLNTELGIFTFGDLLEHYPFRYEDRSKFHRIADLNDTMPAAQILGKVMSIELVQGKGKPRLVATLNDGSASMELVWFQGITYFQKLLQIRSNYIVYGKPSFFGGTYTIQHPEIELYQSDKPIKTYFQAIYPLTEKLRKRFVVNHFQDG
jgi:ATP-dependent DNA helicase RecG